MKKIIQKKRISKFDVNRGCFLSKDGQSYTYSYWDDNKKCMCEDTLIVGVHISLEIAMALDEMDHGMDLNDRYENELRDPEFEAKLDKHLADDKDTINPWEMIADRRGSAEDMLLFEPGQENPQAVEARRVIEEDCTESQQDFFFDHFGSNLPLEEIRQAEIARTGKLLSSAAMTNRKNKIVEKTAKALGVERIKRHKYPKG